MKYLKLINGVDIQTKFELFEEIKYTPEHKKLIQQLRYRLNKFFGKNCCGVSKLRFLPVNSFSRYSSQEYLPYTGSTMLFSIYVPSHIYGDQILDYENKIEEYVKMANEIGLSKETNYDERFCATEEQMKELISRMRYIEEYVIAKKYNL